MVGLFRTHGQQTALAVVERAVTSEQPPHALLLSGPPRVGKTTLALDLFAGLLCLAEPPTARPCRACLACRKVESGTHPDVHRLAPEGAGGQIRIGQVQALGAELALLPLEGRCRMAVIEQAQRLNPDAQNALLKLLEEPPARVTIVLAADEPSGLLPTVISRCARVRLGPVAPSAIAQILAQRSGLDALRGEQIGRQSAGMVGLALDLAARPELLLARGRVARTLLDLIAADRRTRLGAAVGLIADGTELAAGVAGTDTAGPDAAEEAVDSTSGGGSRSTAPRRPARSAARAAPAERRAAVRAVVDIWRDLARDLALAGRGATAELRQRDLIDELVVVGRVVESSAVARFVERLDGIGRAVEAYANPELALDALLLEWPHATAEPGHGQAA
jgi:DNA polymerase III subunit delta'